jgi:hypothetical protein
MARSKFTPENRALIIANSRAGVPLTETSRHVGVGIKTIEGWLRRGRQPQEGDELYVEFVSDVEQAREEFERAGLTRDEFDKHLATAVRSGSVQAMKLWADLHIKSKPEDPADDGDQGKDQDPFTALEREDELAQQREKKQAAG